MVLHNRTQKKQHLQDEEIKARQTDIDTLGARIQIHKQKAQQS